MSKRKFALLKRREEFQSHYTVLDIGTEFVKALVVKREDDKGIVIGASRIRQQLTDMQGGAVADIQSVIDNCDRALTEAEDMCEIVPGQAVMGIAGEQVRGFSHHDGAEAAASSADPPPPTRSPRTRDRRNPRTPWRSSSRRHSRHRR